MSDQLRVWEGEFGGDYTDRNIVDWRSRLSAFRQMLDGLVIKRALEVGCNRGHNLIAVSELLGEKSDVIGIDPNRYALEIARKSSHKVSALHGDAFDLPFKNSYFDLVFTAGVLIHIPLPDLSSTLKEIYRVSRRYILAIEYFAEEETVIEYRGHNDLLWKRNFLKHYKDQFPDLVTVRNGRWEQKDGFDKTHWWLFEKPAGPDQP
jgi:pseudaminic acid biosynthesis-associated methylase